MFHKEDNDDSAVSSLSQALGASLNTEIKLVANCRIRVKVKNRRDPFRQVVTAIGKEKMYFLDQELKKVKFSFNYDNITYVTIESMNLSSIMICLENVYSKETEIPHVYITLADRDSFLGTFKCFYTVYFADQYSLMKDLIIRETDYIEFDGESASLDKYKNIFHFPPENHKVYQYKNYLFFIPPAVREVEFFKFNFNIQNPYYNVNLIDPKINSSMYESNNDFTIFNLKKNKPKIESEFLKCELMMKIKLDKDLKLIKNSDNNYIDFNAYNEFINYINKRYLCMAKLVVSKDHSYFKKFNLAEDYSNWDGWRIEALITYPKMKKVIFITIRRKFIPPFFENYSDFSFICFVNLENLNHNQILDFKEKENYELNKIIETIVDSIYPENVLNYRDFLPVLETKFDSLCLDGEDFCFYNETLKIFGPETYKLAMKFILKVFDDIVTGGYLGEIEVSVLSNKKYRDERFLNLIKNFQNFYMSFFKQVLKCFKSEKFQDDNEVPRTPE